MDIYYSAFKIFSVLAIVLAMIFILLYLVRNFWGKRIGLPCREGIIRILARTYLGPKKEIAVIETGEDILVIGITENGISLLTKIEGDLSREHGAGIRDQHERFN